MENKFDKTKTCAFTGNRPKNLTWGENEQDERCLKLKEQLTKEIQTAINNGYTHFLTGMAQGFDTYAAEAVIEIMKTNKNITLEAVIPYADQSKSWCDSDVERYKHILEQCTNVLVLFERYVKGCFHIRNRHLVDNAFKIIVCKTKESGGSHSTFLLAKRKNIDIIQIISV